MLTAAVVASAAHLARLPRDRAAAAAACGSGRCSATPSCSSTSRSRSTPSATTSAGPLDAPVTLVEYGDFECPYCGQAEPVVRELLADFGDVRYVWRHLPLTDVHPHAQLAAEAAEAAAAQGTFWEMHDLLLAHQDALRAARPRRATPSELGLDVDRFTRRARAATSAPGRVAEDVDSADLSDVSGTPTFFINGMPPPGRLRHRDAVRSRSRGPARASIAA